MPTIHQHKIRAQIEQDILPILKEAPHAPTEEKRLFAAAFTVYAMQAVANLDIEDAIEALTDGPGDAGFDGLHIDGDTAYIFQTKWFDKADRHIGERDAARVLKSLGDFFDGSPLPGVSPRVEEKLRGIAKDAQKYRVIFASSGEGTHENAAQMCENFGQSREDFLAFEHLSAIDLARLNAPLSSQNRRKPSLIMFRGGAYPEGVVKTDAGDIRGIVGVATGADLVDFYKSSDRELSLFMNVRAFLGRGKISRDITETARGDFARHFWFMNNGVSVVCDNYQAVPQNGATQVTVENPWIVNGAQTVNSLLEIANDISDEVKVLVRIYAIPRGDSDEDRENLMTKITIGLNSQNPVSLRDLKANEEPLRIAQTIFAAKGVFLERKRGEFRSLEKEERQKYPPRNRVRYDTVFQAHVSLHEGAPHDAYAKKTQTIDKRFDKVFGREFSPDSFFRSYELLIFASRKKRAREIEAKTAKKDGGGNGIAYLRYAQQALIYAMGLACPDLKKAKTLRAADLEKAYQAADKAVRKVVEARREKLGEEYSHSTLFKSSELEKWIRDEIEGDS